MRERDIRQDDLEVHGCSDEAYFCEKRAVLWSANETMTDSSEIEMAFVTLVNITFEQLISHKIEWQAFANMFLVRQQSGTSTTIT